VDGLPCNLNGGDVEFEVSMLGRRKGREGVTATRRPILVVMLIHSEDAFLTSTQPRLGSASLPTTMSFPPML
jgi:hypothetical protein